MNIVLIGFMGVGKSAIGHQLAKQLNMNFLDTDELIEKTEKMSISDIFAKKGEPHFRDLETEVIKTLQDYDNFIISTGGGMVLREENVKMLKEIGPLVLLWAEPNVVFERVKNETHRPLIEDEDKKKKIEQILESRREIYHKISDLIVDTSQYSVEESVKRIINYVQTKTKS